MPETRINRTDMTALKSRTAKWTASMQCNSVDMMDMTRNSQHKFCHSVRCVKAAASIGNPVNRDEKMNFYFSDANFYCKTNNKWYKHIQKFLDLYSIQ